MLYSGWRSRKLSFYDYKSLTITTSAQHLRECYKSNKYTDYNADPATTVIKYIKEKVESDAKPISNLGSKSWRVNSKSICRATGQSANTR